MFGVSLVSISDFEFALGEPDDPRAFNPGLDLATVEARKLEHHWPRAPTVKYKESQH